MNLKALFPGSLKKAVKSRLDVFGRHELQNSVSKEIMGSPGEVARLYSSVRNIPGWFTYDDCAHFALVLGMLRAQGVSGDMLEIGTYHGRAAAVMARFLDIGRTFVICDIFDQEIGETYRNPPTEQGARENISRVNPHVTANMLELHKCNSMNWPPFRPDS